MEIALNSQRLSFSKSERLIAAIDAMKIDTFMRALHDKNARVAQSFEMWLRTSRCSCGKLFDKTGVIYLHAGGKWWECSDHTDGKEQKQ